MHDIWNETRAIEKLCKQSHKNIITVFQTGHLRNSPFYFFDMELCSYDLEVYIYHLWRPESYEGANSRMDIVWDIMVQIANGVSFIHSKNEVHRDLKPRNSIIPTTSGI